MSQIQKCCDCKQNKDLENFYKYKEGHQKRCKQCTKIRNKKFKDRRPEYYKKGGTGYGYDKIENKELFNKKRYKKYKHEYTNRNKINRQTPRGAMYGVFEAVRERAKKSGYQLDFDLNYILSLYEKQGGKCSATGIEFQFSNTTRVKRFRPFSVSIDRIDSNGKYERSNIRLVCVAFNLALNAFGEEVFKQISLGFLGLQKN